MLYVTTRNNVDQFTAQKAICEFRGPDGGMFIPFQLKRFDAKELKELANVPFLECVAKILNYLFQCNLTRWDLEFGIGRYPVRLEILSHRIVMAETWHNPQWNYSGMVREIFGLMQGKVDASKAYGPWLETGVRVAVLFGIMGELIRSGIASDKNLIDISVVGGDFSAPVSAWVGRAMGLPVGNIVICFNENSSVWNLLHHGEFRTDTVAIDTQIPEADIAMPSGLECLIGLCCGSNEVNSFVDTCRKGKMYCPEDKMLQYLQQGIEASVVSEMRVMETIPNVFGTSGYLFSPYTALAYAGLLDYRARTGESRYGIVLAEKSPAKDAETVAEALKISLDEMNALLKKL